MSLAWELSQRSQCSRLKVGCVISSTDFRKILAVGYNGGAAGQDDACESSDPGMCGHLHAEENAIINCDSPRSVEKIVFVTHLPCKMCAKRLINLGNVKSVYFSEMYRNSDSLSLFSLARIGCYNLNPSNEGINHEIT